MKTCAASSLHNFPVPSWARREGRVINIVDSEAFEKGLHDVN